MKNTIIYHVDNIYMIPECRADGRTNRLELGEDKNTQEGVFITDSGVKGPLIIKRK